MSTFTEVLKKKNNRYYIRPFRGFTFSRYKGNDSLYGK